MARSGKIFLGIKLSYDNFHFVAKEGKQPYLLLPPNFEEPSTRKVAVSKYLFAKPALTRPKKDCNSSAAELELLITALPHFPYLAKARLLIIKSKSEVWKLEACIFLVARSKRW